MGSSKRRSAAALRVYDVVLEAALDERVSLHRLRRGHEISVPDYLAGLEAVRNVEDILEPLRREQGAVESRAMGLVRRERPDVALLNIEEAA